MRSLVIGRRGCLHVGGGAFEPSGIRVGGLFSDSDLGGVDVFLFAGPPRAYLSYITVL